MFYVYDAEGNRFGMHNAIDQRTALKTGKYTKLPPGSPEPVKKPKPVKGEIAEGITAPKPDPGSDEEASEKTEQPAPKEKAKIKRQ